VSSRARPRWWVALPVLLPLALLACDSLTGRSLGERVWRDRCASCHGVDAAGNTVRYMGVAAADLTDDDWKHGGDEESIAEVIRSGVFGAMPASDDLTDEEVTAVIDWLYYLRGERQ